MLPFLRQNTKVIVWFAVILLVGVFGLSSVSLNKHDQYAGEVFGKKISFQEFRIFETLTRILPPSPKVNEDAAVAKQYTWQQLLLSREAKNKKFEVSDLEVRAHIDQLVNPNPEKPLSQPEYFALLKSRQTTPHEFESGVREMIRIQKMMAKQFQTPENEAPLPTDKKEAEAKLEERKNKLQADYVTWLSEIYARSKIVDYSEKRRAASAPQDSK